MQCQNSIKDENHCKKAATYLANSRQQGVFSSKFVEASGNGYDLPYGCIAELEDHDYGYGYGNLSYVYWNPNGVSLSADGHIREVCYNPATSFDGNPNSSINIPSFQARLKKLYIQNLNIPYYLQKD